MGGANEVWGVEGKRCALAPDFEKGLCVRGRGWSNFFLDAPNEAKMKAFYGEKGGKSEKIKAYAPLFRENGAWRGKINCTPCQGHF